MVCVCVRVCVFVVLYVYLAIHMCCDIDVGGITRWKEVSSFTSGNCWVSYGSWECLGQTGQAFFVMWIVSVLYSHLHHH